MAAAGLDPDFWRGRRVLLTGHTGFKGAWAALWLHRMGAKVSGLALEPDALSLYRLAGVDSAIESRIADLRDRAAVAEVVRLANPEIVLHMAAQPIVKRSIADPIETFETNVMGTVHLMDALRSAEALRTVLVVTSDKVYANSEDGRAFCEDDALGGKDPYSGSKAATEVAARSMAKTYLEPKGVRFATARGGNVVGGGDFAADRLAPDVVRAVEAKAALNLRHPAATRPWQHVLDANAGYFAYIEALDRGDIVPPSLNFGPMPGQDVSVGELAGALFKAMGREDAIGHQPEPGSVEMKALAIDSTLARRTLGWRDRVTGERLVEMTAGWYRDWIEGRDMAAATLAQIDRYEDLA